MSAFNNQNWFPLNSSNRNEWADTMRNPGWRTPMRHALNPWIKDSTIQPTNQSSIRAYIRTRQAWFDSERADVFLEWEPIPTTVPHTEHPPMDYTPCSRLYRLLLLLTTRKYNATRNVSRSMNRLTHHQIYTQSITADGSDIFTPVRSCSDLVESQHFVFYKHK